MNLSNTKHSLAVLFQITYISPSKSKKPKNPWILPEMHIGFLITKHVLHFLYNACGKWYFQSKISPFGLIQAGHTKLENGVSLSMGIVEKIWNMFCDQGANVHLWLNSRMFWFFRLTLVAIIYYIRSYQNRTF